MYFGPDVEEAIVEYCKSESSTQQQILFNSKIYPALSKLAENRIHISKLTNFGNDTYSDTKQDCVCFLYEKLGKFDPSRGYKAFSYFDRISINWVWARMRTIAEDTYGKCDMNQIDLSRDVDLEVIETQVQDELREFCRKWSEWGMEHLDYFYFVNNNKIVHFSKKEKQVLNAIFNLFENSSTIDIYRKKALYILIREQVEVKTQIITNVVNVLRPMCQEMLIEYKRSGTKFWHRFLYYPDGMEEITEP